MPENEVAVADTSVLLNLAFIERLRVLENQFEIVFVPEQVWNEVLEGEKGREAIQEMKDGFFKKVSVKKDGLYRELNTELDSGESACIVYALNQKIDLVLLDESEGWRKAKNHGLEVTGVIGLLMNEGLDMKEELDNLRQEGFWISDKLYEKIVSSSN